VQLLFAIISLTGFFGERENGNKKMNNKKEIENRLTFVMLNNFLEARIVYFKPIFPPSAALPIKGDFLERRKLFFSNRGLSKKRFCETAPFSTFGAGQL